MCQSLNEIASSLRLMEEQWEVIMQEKQQHKRFYVLGYHGRPYIRIQKCIVGHAAHAKGWVDPRAGMRYH